MRAELLDRGVSATSVSVKKHIATLRCRLPDRVVGREAREYQVHVVQLSCKSLIAGRLLYWSGDLTVCLAQHLQIVAGVLLFQTGDGCRNLFRLAVAPVDVLQRDNDLFFVGNLLIDDVLGLFEGI